MNIEDKAMNSTKENNNSVFENLPGNKIEEIDQNLYKKMIADTLNNPASVELDGKAAYEMKNFADVTRSSIGSEGKRLDSEEFENISVSAVEGKEPEDVFKESDNDLLALSKVNGKVNKKKGRSVDAFEPTEEDIVEEDYVERQSLKDLKNLDVNKKFGQDCKAGNNGSSDHWNYKEGTMEYENNGTDYPKGSKKKDGNDANSSVVSEHDYWITGDELSMDGSRIDEDKEDIKEYAKAEDTMKPEGLFARRIISLNNKGHLSDLRRRSEGASKLSEEQDNLSQRMAKVKDMSEKLIQRSQDKNIFDELH